MKTYHSIIDPAIALLAESNGTRSEQYSSTEFTATVEYHGPWRNRNAIINALRDTVFPVTVENLGPYYSYYQPASVQSVSISPVGLEGVHINSDFHTPHQPYTLAKYSVQYKGLARPGNSSIQEQVTPNIQMRQLPSFGYYWYSDGAPVLDKEAPAIRESHLTINRTITGVRILPDFFFGLAGCVTVSNAVVEYRENVTESWKEQYGDDHGYPTDYYISNDQGTITTTGEITLSGSLFRLVLSNDAGTVVETFTGNENTYALVYDATTYTVMMETDLEGMPGFEEFVFSDEVVSWEVMREKNNNQEEQIEGNRVECLHADVYDITGYVNFYASSVASLVLTIGPRPLYLENLTYRFEE